MKIAIVHEWYDSYAGSEKVVEQILKIYPQADLFSVVDFLPMGQRDFILNKKVKTTFIQNLPFAKNKFRNYLSLMPFAIEQLDLSKYDLIISSSHAVAKGVITGPDQFHISYVHSPIRYAWDLQHQYLRETGLDKGLKGWVVRYLLHRIRKWDLGTANRVDLFIANSNFIRRRINKVYRRGSEVIFPPVSVEDFSLCDTKEDFYLTASRMVPYKKIEMIVRAFVQMPDKKLKVIGMGPDFQKIQKIAKEFSNIDLMGYQSFEVLRHSMQKAKAFVFAAEEDFGIIPVEAQACGTPVIAFGKGGVLDTVIDGKTGVLYEEQTVGSLTSAIDRFENISTILEPGGIREHSLQFSNDIFREKFGNFVEKKFREFKEVL